MTQPTKTASLMAYGDSKPLLADAQVAAIADISVTGTYTTDDTPIETAVNSILATLRAHGLIADS